LTPSQLSKRFLEEQGYVVWKTEHWNAFAHIRQDLFGFADFIACQVGKAKLLIQTTTLSNVSARIKKILSNPIAAVWIDGGRDQIVVHGWFKKGRKWEVKEVFLS